MIISWRPEPVFLEWFRLFERRYSAHGVFGSFGIRDRRGIGSLRMCRLLLLQHDVLCDFPAEDACPPYFIFFTAVFLGDRFTEVRGQGKGMGRPGRERRGSEKACSIGPGPSSSCSCRSGNCSRGMAAGQEGLDKSFFHNRATLTRMTRGTYSKPFSGRIPLPPGEVNS